MSMSELTDPPRVSVVVPVYNRPDQLHRLLLSFENLDYEMSAVEILICDDGSQEDISQVVSLARDRQKLSVICLSQNNQGPGAARNLGLSRCRGQLMVFTDSDCEVAPGWLTGLLSAFADPAVGIAGGLVLPHSDSPTAAQCSNWIMSSLWGAGARDPRCLVSMNYFPRAGNLAVRTSLARACGGFLNARYAEDIDFSNRVVALGTQATFCESAVVYHNESRTLWQIFNESFRKGVARIRQWRCRKQMELLHTLPAVFVIYLFVIVTVILVRPRMVAPFSVPGILYAGLLVLVGCQAAARVPRTTALVVAPCCCVLMHMGYGLGLLSALISTLRSPMSKDVCSERKKVPGRAGISPVLDRE